jgi:hypothetical protein
MLLLCCRSLHAMSLWIVFVDLVLFILLYTSSAVVFVLVPAPYNCLSIDDLVFTSVCFRLSYDVVYTLHASSSTHAALIMVSI